MKVEEKIKAQNVYTDLFFNKPSRAIDVLNKVIKYVRNNQSAIDIYGNETVLAYYVPLEANRELLSQLFDVDRYLEVSQKEYESSEIKNDILCIDLFKIISDLTYVFGVELKVREDEDYAIYCDEDETEKLFDITWKTEKTEQEIVQAKEAEEKAIKDGLYTDIMIDNETLDTVPTAVILSIAAQPFNIATGERCPEVFNTSIQIEPQIAQGRTTSIETTLWWGKQSDEAQVEAFKEETPLLNALIDLRQFTQKYCSPTTRFWARSPKLDLAIINNALGTDLPIWEYHQERDVRTYLWAIPIINTRRHYVATHIAYQDVADQISEVCQAYKDLNNEKACV